MADFVVVDADINALTSGFSSIKKNIEAADTKLSAGVVGQENLARTMSNYADQVNKFKNKYTKKADAVVSLLRAVKEGSNRVDQGLADGAAGKGGGQSSNNPVGRVVRPPLPQRSSYEQAVHRLNHVH